MGTADTTLLNKPETPPPGYMSEDGDGQDTGADRMGKSTGGWLIHFGRIHFVQHAHIYCSLVTVWLLAARLRNMTRT